MAIAITGANGQLGSELLKRFGDRSVALTRPWFDMTSRDSIVAGLMSVAPSAVINCAAYTSIDKAESEVETCHAVNADAVAIIAEVCEALDIPLVQLSSNYVFGMRSNRNTPYRENDATGPQGSYARSKHEGELNAAFWHKHFIIRTCGLYSLSEKGPIRGRNFVDTMMHLATERNELSAISDQYCTPTYVPHLVDAIEYLIGTERYGTYHVANTGQTNWSEFAEEIFRQAGMSHMSVKPTTTETWGAVAPRPEYSVLNTAKYHDLCGPRMPDWQEGIADYLQRLAQLKSNDLAPALTV